MRLVKMLAVAMGITAIVTGAAFAGTLEDVKAKGFVQVGQTSLVG